MSFQFSSSQAVLNSVKQFPWTDPDWRYPHHLSLHSSHRIPACTEIRWDFSVNKWFAYYVSMDFNFKMGFYQNDTEGRRISPSFCANRNNLITGTKQCNQHCQTMHYTAFFGNLFKCYSLLQKGPNFYIQKYYTLENSMPPVTPHNAFEWP